MSWTLATQALSSTAVTILAALFFPSAARSFLPLDPVVPDMYSIFVCCHGYSCVEACEWTVNGDIFAHIQCVEEDSCV